jgi:hypothetical protein
MGKTIIKTLIFISLGQFALGQSLVPATTDDLTEFDQQISKDSNKTPEATKDQKSSGSHAKKSKNPNFGALVSQEAKDLKKSDGDQKKKMGQWVSEQRRNDDQKVPAESAGKGQSSTNSPGKDARMASPANGPGQSKNHRK